MQIDVLKRAAAPAGLPCFSIVRNESYFLPHFLDHYRRLGVGHFIFYDDESSDGTRELLMAQEDCTVVASQHSFQQRMGDGKPFHYHARTVLPERFAGGGWCLVVDADEFLLLPPRFDSLTGLIAELEAREHICVLAPMVDFYPRRLSERHYPAHLGPFDGCEWWFDRDPGFVRAPARALIKPVPRGVRTRLLGMLQSRAPGRLKEIYPGGSPTFAKLWKVPLLKTGLGIKRIDTHSVNVMPPSDIQLALAHFKFYPATDSKVREALEKKNYFNASTEYRFLDLALEMLSDEDLVCDRSVKFQSAKSLENAGLLFAREKDVAPPPGAENQVTVNSSAKLENLFATPVVLDSIQDPALIEALEGAILKRRSEDPGIVRSNAGGWHSDDALFDWGGEPARRLLNRIFKLASAQTRMKADRADATFDWVAEGWANVNGPGASNSAHAHPGCFWSAVFYVRVDPGTGGELLLQDPRSPAMEMYAPSLWFANAGVQREGTIKPVTGTLVLFPSWLVHSVTPWFGDGLRISIAVNLGVKIFHGQQALPVQPS